MTESAPSAQNAGTSPTAGPQPPTRRSDEYSHVVPDLIAAVCPFLVSSDGAWRAAAPAREHRCGATEPPGRLPMDKQENLCLRTAHLDCPLFEAAAGLTVEPHLEEAARAAAELDPGAVPATLAETGRTGDELAAAVPSVVPDPRPMPRTTPVILDRARPALDMHLPRFHLPSVALRRPTAGGRGRSTVEAPRTRIEELRAERLRARESKAAVALADVIAPERSFAETATRASTRDLAGLALNSRAAADRPSSGNRNPGGVGGAGGTGSGVPPVSRGSGGTDGGGRFGARSGSGGRPGGPGDGGDVASGAPDDQRSGSDRGRRLDRPAPTADPPIAASGRRRFMPVGGFGAFGRVGGARDGLDGVRAAMAGRELQAALAGLLGLALVLVLIVRFSGSSAGVAGASSSPRPAAAASVAPSGSVQPGPTVASPSSALAPSARPAVTARPTPNPTKTPAAARTYRVQPGDTLSAIAARFGTTAATLMRLNNIKDPRALRIGQVLQLP
jgi:LysM repeat protein